MIKYNQIKKKAQTDVDRWNKSIDKGQRVLVIIDKKMISTITTSKAYVWGCVAVVRVDELKGVCKLSQIKLHKR